MGQQTSESRTKWQKVDLKKKKKKRKRGFFVDYFFKNLLKKLTIKIFYLFIKNIIKIS